MAERQKMICDECPAHGIEVDRRARQRQDIDKLEARLDRHHEKIEAVERSIGLIQKDICSIQKNLQGFKKPLWILGAAVTTQVIQMVFKAINVGAVQ